eukprot:1159490-Pelagomonas_calceolata.AAC.8
MLISVRSRRREDDDGSACQILWYITTGISRPAPTLPHLKPIVIILVLHPQCLVISYYVQEHGWHPSRSPLALFSAFS